MCRQQLGFCDVTLWWTEHLPKWYRRKALGAILLMWKSRLKDWNYRTSTNPSATAATLHSVCRLLPSLLLWFIRAAAKALVEFWRLSIGAFQNKINLELKPIDNTVGWSKGFELRTIHLMVTLASTAINLIQLFSLYWGAKNNNNKQLRRKATKVYS